MAFPAISTGAYRYPLNEAAKIALTAVCDAAASHTEPNLILFVLVTEDAFRIFAKALTTLAAERGDSASN
jgi:O-acetyl-ADP-ribose deacetylase (regulator of RNase III)